MRRALAGGIDTVMTCGTTGITDGAVIHSGGCSKSSGGMTDIAGNRGGNMGR